MTTKPTAKMVKEFMKAAKTVTCKNCGQEFQTTVAFKECYICSADMKDGNIYN